MDIKVTNVKPSVVLGSTKIEGKVNDLHFNARIADDTFRMKDGAFQTKVLDFDIEGVCDYGESEKFITKPTDFEFVKEFVFTLASSFRYI